MGPPCPESEQLPRSTPWGGGLYPSIATSARLDWPFPLDLYCTQFPRACITQNQRERRSGLGVGTEATFSQAGTAGQHRA